MPEILRDRFLKCLLCRWSFHAVLHMQLTDRHFGWIRHQGLPCTLGFATQMSTLQQTLSQQQRSCSSPCVLRMLPERAAALRVEHMLAGTRAHLMLREACQPLVHDDGLSRGAAAVEVPCTVRLARLPQRLLHALPLTVADSATVPACRLYQTANRAATVQKQQQYKVAVTCAFAGATTAAMHCC